MIAAVRDLLARRVLLPLYCLQRMVRPSRQAAMRACREGRRVRLAALAWPDARKADWVLQQLRTTVRHAYGSTNFYRAHCDAIGFDPAADFSFEDFARLPILDRTAVAAAGRGLLARSLPPEGLRRDATGGSTGLPTEIWMGPEELGWRESGVDHFMARIGVPKGSRTAFLWGHHLDPVGSDGLKERMYSLIENLRWFECLRLSRPELRRYHQELEQWRPRCLIAYASALGALADVVQQDNRRPVYPTHCFVTGAEKLLPHHRALIERVYGRPVHERYGSRDVGLMAFQVIGSSGADFEVDWANVLIEPETADEHSPILVTKLHADGMPMLRYQVGDVAQFPAGSRPGHPAFRLREILGRTADRVWLADGGWVDGITFPHMFKDQPVREFQVLQRADLSVELRVVPAGGFTMEHQHQILQTVRANLPGLDVQFALMERIPRTRANKLRPVVSERV